MSWWDDLSTFASPYAGKLDELLTEYGDFLPGLASVQGGRVGLDLAKGIGKALDFGPFAADPLTSTSSAASAAPRGIQFTGAAAELGGASGSWEDVGVQSAMIGTNFMNGFNGTIASGPRRILPYTGGVIPSGYRVAQRSARRPTPGYPGGTYLVPRRTMNPLNPRALMRAERRMNSFTTWVKRHFRIASAAPKRRRKVGAVRRRRK